MTKEAILSKKNWSSEYPNYMAESEILDAMDIYAKQEVIEFSNWKDKNFNKAIGGFTHVMGDLLYKGMFSNKDLYLLFLQGKETKTT